MRQRSVNSSTLDWQFGGGLSNYVQNQAAAIQLINSRILCFLGDCFFDAGNGIPWFQYLGSTGAAQSQLALQLAVQATILNTQDDLGNQIVTAMIQLSVNLNRGARSLSISYEAATIYSTITSALFFELYGVGSA